MKTSAILGIVAALALTLTLACNDDGGKADRDLTAAPTARQGQTGPAAGGAPATGGDGVTRSPSGDSLQPGDRLTVQGSGWATAPANAAILSFAIVLDPGFDPIGTPCPPSQPCPPPVSRSPASPPLTGEDFAPVLDAIREQGIGDDDILSATQAGVYVAVRDLKKLDDIVAAVSVATQASQRVALLAGAGITYTISADECLALKQQSIEAAIADARRQVQYQAQGFDLVVRNVSVDADFSVDCSLYGHPFDAEIGFRLPVSFYVSGQPAEVRIFSNVTVTFAIQ